MASEKKTGIARFVYGSTFLISLLFNSNKGIAQEYTFPDKKITVEGYRFPERKITVEGYALPDKQGLPKPQNETSLGIGNGNWYEISTGLYLMEFFPNKNYANGEEIRRVLSANHPIRVLKVNLDHYVLQLLSRSEHGRERYTAETWANEFGMVATINAGMFARDYTTHVGYMRNFGHVNNSRLIRNGYNAMLAFNPVDSFLYPIKIFELDLSSFDSIERRYNTLLQNIRMVDSTQRNVWAQSNQIYSIAAMAVDRENNLLMVHSRTPYSVHDFIDILINNRNLNIYNAMYLEGGPESSLFLNVGNITIRSFGSYESAVYQKDDNDGFWVLPNVIGLKPRK